jgi:sugar lactone lactonase YvrE
MRKLLAIVGVLLLLAVAYLLLWPVGIDPVAWQAPKFEGYAGPHARNERLAAAKTIPVGLGVGPEHVEFGPDGYLYTGVLSGAILRHNPEGTLFQKFADTGGRPLGMDFDTHGNLIVADALRGLLMVTPDGQVSTLLDKVADTPIRYADAVVVMSNGPMYLTDASQRITPQEWGTFDAAVIDILEHSCTGRVIEYDPSSKSARIVMSDLCFPNGVALSANEKHLFIAETGKYRIWKVDVTSDGLSAKEAEQSPGAQARVILDNLPGYPDNVTSNGRGRLWTGLTKPRSAAIDGMADKPLLRKVTLRLPKALWPVPPAYGHVIGFDEEGRVVADLQDPSGRIPETSGATEHLARLYIQSLHGDQLGMLRLTEIGLQ